MLRLLLKLSSLPTRCWGFAWYLYRLYGIPLIGPPDELIWYFAYGANMHDSAFRDWRGMHPVEWRPARLPGYRLGFDVRQLPGRKMAYANMCADPQAETWGVIYRITRRELVRLDATEGIPWSRYRQLWLEAEDIAGNTLRAVTYIAKAGKENGAPSLHYLALMREGARAHGLPERYIRLLDRIRPMR
jgi:cation transport regulator ChaC